MLPGVQSTSAQEPWGQLEAMGPHTQGPVCTTGTEEIGQAGHKGSAGKADVARKEGCWQRRPAASWAGVVWSPRVAPVTDAPRYSPGLAAQSWDGAPALGGLQGPGPGRQSAAPAAVLVQSEEPLAEECQGQVGPAAESTELGTQRHCATGPDTTV